MEIISGNIVLSLSLTENSLTFNASTVETLEYRKWTAILHDPLVIKNNVLTSHFTPDAVNNILMNRDNHPYIDVKYPVAINNSLEIVFTITGSTFGTDDYPSGIIVLTETKVDPNEHVSVMFASLIKRLSLSKKNTEYAIAYEGPGRFAEQLNCSIKTGEDIAALLRDVIVMEKKILRFQEEIECKTPLL
jgi:hypothetical protein